MCVNLQDLAGLVNLTELSHSAGGTLQGYTYIVVWMPQIIKSFLTMHLSVGKPRQVVMLANQPSHDCLVSNRLSLSPNDPQTQYREDNSVSQLKINDS